MAQAVHGEIRDDETKKCQCEHAGGMDLRGLRISRPAWRIVESARRAPHVATGATMATFGAEGAPRRLLRDDTLKFSKNI